MAPKASPITITNAHGRLRLEEATIERLVQLVCKSEGVRLSELSIVLTDHATVLQLNRSYLAHDYETDVLSFSFNESSDHTFVDGEIYVDLDTAFERCDEFGVVFEIEAFRYIVHGLLHLIGYSDELEEQKSEMKAKENFYLAGLAKS